MINKLISGRFMLRHWEASNGRRPQKINKRRPKKTQTENDLKKMEDDLKKNKKNKRRPQKNKMEEDLNFF